MLLYLESKILTLLFSFLFINLEGSSSVMIFSLNISWFITRASSFTYQGVLEIKEIFDFIQRFLYLVLFVDIFICWCVTSGCKLYSSRACKRSRDTQEIADDLLAVCIVKLLWIDG